MLLLAQISDLHLDGTARSTERVSRVMDHLRALPRPVDALLVTGDIADHGDPAEYRAAAALLAAPFPVLPCPGNHDRRAAYRTALLGEPAADGPVNRMHRIGDTAVLMCDSTIPDNDDGQLGDETLGWLAATLDALGPRTPALVAFHHTPVAVHHPLPDRFPLTDAPRLADLLAGYPQVAAVLVGHAHTAAASTFAGRPLRVAPGVTWTLRLPWEGDAPADREAAPGIAFHVLDDEGTLTTHYRAVH
ncbi:metallophosphoesterase [Micromonospora sp. NPDC049559]|uniref:metallophosphoesterase n=1 Tax=Micromonospora sp. NPDC049559 TaxID=3155923 RepID=UPI00342AD16A